MLPTPLGAAGVARECGQGTNVPTARASHNSNNIGDSVIVTTGPRAHLYIIIVMITNFLNAYGAIATAPREAPYA